MSFEQNTIHFHPLLGNQFSKIESEIDGYNSIEIEKLKTVPEELTFSDKLKMQDEYKKLKTKKDNNVIEELNEKLNKKIEERSIKINNYSLSTDFIDHLFFEGLSKLFEEYNIQSGLIPLKLNNNCYKMIDLNKFDINRDFEINYSLYKKICPELKVDLTNAKLVVNKYCIEKKLNSEEFTEKFNKFIKAYSDYFSVATQDVNIDDIIVEDYNDINNILNLFHKNHIITSKELNNLSLVIMQLNSVNSKIKEINSAITELNKIGSANLNYVNMNQLMGNKNIISTYNDKKPFIIFNDNYGSNIKGGFFDLREKPEIEESEIYKNIQEFNSKNIKTLMEEQKENDNISDDIKLILYNEHFKRIILFDNIKNIPSEFIKIKEITTLQYNLLSKYFMNEIDEYDESDNINDIKEFIDRCVKDLEEKEETSIVEYYIRNYYTLSTSIEDRIKFTDIMNTISKDLPIKISTIQLANILKSLGLNKKRYNDGVYWYGLVPVNLKINDNNKITNLLTS